MLCHSVNRNSFLPDREKTVVIDKSISFKIAMFQLVIWFSCFTSFLNAEDSFALPSKIEIIIKKHCVDCHNADSSEADIQLDVFSKLTKSQRLSLLEKIQEQLYLNLMPPEDEDQLSTNDKSLIVDWIYSELAKDGRDIAFKQRMKSFKYANYVDHDSLFSGEYRDLNGFTYDRKWMISEYIFKEKMNELLKIGESKRTSVDGKSRVVRGNALHEKIANPFLLPGGSGVRYYANKKMSSGHLMTMIGNSKHVSESMINYLSGKYPDFLPSVRAITQAKLEHNAVMESRNIYLSNQIDRVCEKLYGDENEDWLPKYNPVKFKDVTGKPLMIDNEGHFPQRKFNFFRNDEGLVIEKGFIRFADNTKGDDLIRKCEKYFVHLGLEKQRIEFLVELLQINLEDFLDKASKERQKRSNAWKYNKPNLKADQVAIVDSTIKKIRTKGMSYNSLQKACLDHWQNEFESSLESANQLQGDLSAEIINELYEKIYKRQPNQTEFEEKRALLLSYSSKMGILETISKLTQTLLLSSEFINRNEYGVGGADEYGRRLMSPRDASYAIAYGLTDSSPDEELTKAVREGRLNTREDYKREIERLLEDRSHIYIIDNVIQTMGGGDNITEQPIRKLRFFREFFGYHEALKVFKDQTRFGHTIGGSRERLIAEADLLVEHILEKDQNVLEELLTTEKFYVYHNSDNENVSKISEQLSNAYHYFEKHNWRDFKSAKDLEQHKDFIFDQGIPGLRGKSRSGKLTSIDKDTFQLFINIMSDYERRFEEGKNKYILPYSNTRQTWFGPKRRLTYRGVTGVQKNENVTFYYNIDPDRWDYQPIQPMKLDHRKGILTHPAWLQAFSQNSQTDPVIRGKWIREKLLAGTIPEIPIGVEAQIPQDHTRTLRARLATVTEKEMCWKCHKFMNPIGNAFEMYDDFGRYRTEEELEHPDNVVGKKSVRKLKVKTHPLQTINNRGVGQGDRLLYKTLPVDTSGVLKGTDDEKLDGDVKDALDMMDRLAKSKKVRQSFIRHTFRYFMGRNEMLSDSKTLIDADNAYIKSNGSFDAVIVSLLTSDSFIYRKEIME